jgi:tRNA threonylcarbamoyladenosine biosynthesis protein TsaB
MPRILAFDASTAACSVALMRDGTLDEKFEVAPRRHAALILPMVDALLQKYSMQLSELDAIAFGQGPGSFMGLRTAVGIAQGLAFAAGLKVIPVSSLQALAQAAYEKTHHEKVIAGWDARMSAIYWGAYRLHDAIMQPVMDDVLNAPEEICLPEGDSWFAAGNAWSIYADGLSVDVRQGFIGQDPEIYPSAGAMARIAVQRFEKGATVDPVDAQPVYLRDNVAKVPTRR